MKVQGKLSDNFRDEFVPMIDQLEKILHGHPRAKDVQDWRSVVVYVTDTTPEFERGEVDVKLSVAIVEKQAAIELELSAKSPAGDTLAAKLSSSADDKTWIIASTADNKINAVECIVYQFYGQPASA